MRRKGFVFSVLICLWALISCYDSGRHGRSLPEDEGTTGRDRVTFGNGDVPVSKKEVKLPQAKKKWTVLVHMNGDNNLSSFSSMDIQEMINSGPDTNMNIVVLWDNDPSQENGADDRHGYYYVNKDGVALLKDTGEVNMGAAGTAKKFADYALKNFPADRYAWIFWNHGGAVDRSRGISWDDTSGGDHLTEIEQKEIMGYFVKKSGKKLAIIGFDACLMATAEIAYQYRDFAYYLVASEQTIPGKGWDYNFLSRIKSGPAMSSKTAAGHIVTYYKNFYVKIADGKDSTLSVIDLSKAGELVKAIDDFSTSAVKSGASRETFTKLAEGLPMFGSYTSGSRKYYYTKDLCGYFDKTAKSSAIPQAARDKAGTISALIKGNKLVVSEWHGSDWSGKAYGLSMTFKHATTVYKGLDICKDSGWDEFLNWAGFPDNDYVY